MHRYTVVCLALLSFVLSSAFHPQRAQGQGSASRRPHARAAPATPVRVSPEVRREQRRAGIGPTPLQRAANAQAATRKQAAAAERLRVRTLRREMAESSRVDSPMHPHVKRIADDLRAFDSLSVVPAAVSQSLNINGSKGAAHLLVVPATYDNNHLTLTADGSWKTVFIDRGVWGARDVQPGDLATLRISPQGHPLSDRVRDLGVALERPGSPGMERPVIIRVPPGNP